MDEELISINVWLCGRSYRIRIKPEEEQAVRTAAKAADDKVRELKQVYAGKDDQDFLAMCLLMYATDSVSASAANPALLSAISSMTAKIDTVLEAED